MHKLHSHRFKHTIISKILMDMHLLMLHLLEEILRKHCMHLWKRKRSRARSCLKTKMPKCMANASFYRPKYGTIDLMTNCWVGLDLVTLFIFLSAENIIANTRIWIDSLHKSSGKLSQLSNKTRIGTFVLLESRYGLNTEQCLNCRTDSNFSVVAIIWTREWHF